jgi:KDO2-lipid IV(A) lauroyltransferase
MLAGTAKSITTLRSITRWLTGRLVYLSTWIGLRTGCLATGTLPREWLFRLSDGFAAVGFRFFHGFRSRSVKNLGVALGDQLDKTAIEKIACASLRNFFRACVEIGVTLNSSDDDVRSDIAVSGRENLDAALAKGKGVIALSAHLGNFFLVGTRLSVDGYTAWVLVNQPREGQFAKLMDDYRLQARQKTIHARPRHAALQELYRVLRGNGIAVVIADEYRKGAGVQVSLFGRPVLARRGPVTLALRTGAAIVPVIMLRGPDNRLRLLIEPEINLARSGKHKSEIKENTVRITRWLEQTVRAYPEQWNWMNIQWLDNGRDPCPLQEPRKTTGEALDDEKGDWA